MNLKKPLSVYVFWETTESHVLKQLNINTGDHTLRNLTFYSVDIIHEWEFSEESNIAGKYGNIIVGGNDYVTNLSYEALKQLIQEHI